MDEDGDNGTADRNASFVVSGSDEDEDMDSDFGSIDSGHYHEKGPIMLTQQHNPADSDSDTEVDQDFVAEHEGEDDEGSIVQSNDRDDDGEIVDNGRGNKDDIDDASEEDLFVEEDIAYGQADNDDDEEEEGEEEGEGKENPAEEEV